MRTRPLLAALTALALGAATAPAIDSPQPTFGTYIGGSGLEYGFAVAVDGAGFVYAAGHTASTDFPLTNAIQRSCGNDGFVTKLDPATGRVVYSTALGAAVLGVSSQVVADVAADAQGNAYVVATVRQTSPASPPRFPICNAVQSEFAGGEVDAFVAKLDPEGRLVYATFLGGSGGEAGMAIAVDACGNASVVGVTSSDDFPTANALVEKRIAPLQAAAFVTRLDPRGRISFSTYLAASGEVVPEDVAVDGAGNTFVTGSTRGGDLPITADALQRQFQGGVVLRWLDGEARWESASPDGLTEASAIALDPDDPELVYAGTKGRGSVSRSVDGGQHWTEVLAAPEGVSALAVAGSTVYAGLADGDPAQVFRSDDRGVTWKAVGSLSAHGPVRALAADSAAPMTVWAAARGAIFKSTDGGVEWQSEGEGTYVAMAPGHPSIVYIAGENGRVRRSDDGSEQWEDLSRPLLHQPQPIGVEYVVVSPGDPDTAFGIWVGQSYGGGTVLRTTDGGETWTQISSLPPFTSTPPFEFRGTSHIAFARNAPHLGWAIGAGRLFRSVDGGATWEPQAPDGERIAGTMAAAGPDHVYLAFEGNEADAYVLALGPDGDLLYSTFLGRRNDYDRGVRIAVDADGDFRLAHASTNDEGAASHSLHITAVDRATGALRFTVPSPVHIADLAGASGVTHVVGYGLGNAGSLDIVLADLDADGQSGDLLRLGGSDADQAWSLAVDPVGVLWTVGTTASADFPITPNAPQSALAGIEDAFVIGILAGQATEGPPTDGECGEPTNLPACDTEALLGTCPEPDPGPDPDPGPGPGPGPDPDPEPDPEPCPTGDLDAVACELTRVTSSAICPDAAWHSGVRRYVTTRLAQAQKRALKALGAPSERQHRWASRVRKPLAQAMRRVNQALRRQRIETACHGVTVSTLGPLLERLRGR